MAQYIKGKLLMVTAAYSHEVRCTIAYATSHTLELSSTLDDTGTKDDNELFVNQEITGQSWSLTTENLIAASSTDAGEPSYADLVKLMRAGEKLQVAFEYLPEAAGKERQGQDWKTGHNGDGGTEISSTVLCIGTALLTSIELNAENRENVSYTATFQGCGALTVEG